MEGDNILEAIYSDDGLDDVEMLDVEEGEFVEKTDAGENRSKDLNTTNQDSEDKVQNQDVNIVNQDSQSKNRRRGGKKKKNKRRKSGTGPNVTNIDRFVQNACRQLREKKSYMVYTAVGCLGISALTDLINEQSPLRLISHSEKGTVHFVPASKDFVTESIQLLPHYTLAMTTFVFVYQRRWLRVAKNEYLRVNAIQECGGQMTADGRRNRNGGGILWNIIKARDPKVFKEITKKAREFEKQFRPQNVRQVPVEKKESSELATEERVASVSDGSEVKALIQTQNERSNDEEAKRGPVHDRIRVPVSYADLVEEGPDDTSIM